MDSNTQLLQEIKQLRTEIASVHNNKEQRIIELSKSEERLRLAMRSTNDGLWDWDLQNNEIYFSPRWKRQLGYEDNELKNKFTTWESIVHFDDRETVFKKIKYYLSGRIDSFEVEVRMRHKNGHFLFISAQAHKVVCPLTHKATRLIGTHVDITKRKKAELFNERNIQILEMIAKGTSASEIYQTIILLYQERHPGMCCFIHQIEDNILIHGGVPSLSQAYSDAIHGIENTPNIDSYGTTSHTGLRVIVENIAEDPKWENLKQFALPHGMRCCWSEPIKSSNGKVLGVFGMYYNHPALPNEDESNDLTSAGMLTSLVMEREQNQKRIRDLAYKDHLTGLSSRAYLHLNITDLIKECALYDRKFSLLYIDLDNFKDINDNLGHDVGDEHLREIGSRLTKITKEADIIARLGGDEFCIIIKELDDSDNAKKVAKRCINTISKPTFLSGRKYIQTCSIGVAHYPADGIDLQSLLKAADTALYTAKEQGKNQYAFYNKKLTEKAEYRFKVEQYLKEAIENQTLSLVYQPQFNINTGKVIGVEALSRWYHPQLGDVSSMDFIAIAERIGMIKPLTECVLKNACNQAVAWKKSGFPAIRMAVNISPSHFIDSDFLPFIKRVINETGMNPCDLELEVTENIAQTDPQNTSIFKDLKELGVLLAIDDFGTGYSSFASLKHLYIDFLKIDKYFIDDMLTDKKTRLLIASMIEIGHNLGYEIIAEGVENPKQTKLLKDLGCETAQGFLFSKPIIADDVATILSNN